jgi:phosphoglycolate phosphatase
MIKVVVFDFDGTLVLSNQIKRDVFDDVTLAAGGTKELVAEVMVNNPKADRHGIFAEISERLLLINGQSDVEAIAEELVKNYSSQCEDRIVSCPETENMLETLAELHAQDYALFVNSATPLDALKNILKRREMTHFFVGIFGRPASKKSNFQEILGLTGALPTETLIVGDGNDDQTVALEMKCHFAAINVASVSSHNRFKNAPKIVLNNLRELPELLAEIE